HKYRFLLSFLSVMRQQSSALLANLLHFGRVLHSLGVDVQAGRMADVVAALAHVDIGRRADFYFTLRSLLVHRPAVLARFDAAFRVFWRPAPHWPPQDLRAMGEQRRVGTPEIEATGTADSPGQEASPRRP